MKTVRFPRTTQEGFRQCAELSETARRWFLDSIRQDHPGASEEEIEQERRRLLARFSAAQICWIRKWKKERDRYCPSEADRGFMEATKTATHPEKVIRQAIEFLRQKIRVQQAVLFGSHVRGEADEWSDIDLAVISPDFAHMGQQEVVDLLVEVALSVDPAVEIRPYTPQDLKAARPTNFLGHILAEGKIVRTYA